MQDQQVPPPTRRDRSTQHVTNLGALSPVRTIQIVAGLDNAGRKRAAAHRAAYAADLLARVPRVGGGAISASAGMPHSWCNLQAILIVRRRFPVRMSEARWREPKRRPRSA